MRLCIHIHNQLLNSTTVLVIRYVALTDSIDRRRAVVRRVDDHPTFAIKMSLKFSHSISLLILSSARVLRVLVRIVLPFLIR